MKKNYLMTGLAAAFSWLGEYLLLVVTTIL